MSLVFCSSLPSSSIPWSAASLFIIFKIPSISAKHLQLYNSEHLLSRRF